MGYRSDGMIYIPNKVYDSLSKEKKDELLHEWNLHSHDSDGVVYEFEYWKWYSEFEDVRFWNRLYQENEDVDLIVIGEDNAIVVEPRFSKFGYSMNIEVY